jgi:hypothetical protein
MLGECSVTEPRVQMLCFYLYLRQSLANFVQWASNSQPTPASASRVAGIMGMHYHACYLLLQPSSVSLQPAQNQELVSLPSLGRGLISHERLLSAPCS